MLKKPATAGLRKLNTDCNPLTVPLNTFITVSAFLILSIRFVTPLAVFNANNNPIKADNITFKIVAAVSFSLK